MKKILIIALNMLLIFGYVYSQAGFSYSYTNSNLFKGTAIVFTKEYKPTIQLPANVQLFTPSEEEIEKSELVLEQRYNKDLIDVDWYKIEKNVKRKYWKYNRQYLGYVDQNGYRNIIVNLLNFKCKKKAEKQFKGWREFFFLGFGEYYEKNTVRFVTNIDLIQLKLL